MNTTIISSSLRKTSSSNKLAFYINLTHEHIKKLDLENREYVELVKSGESYKLRFLEKETPRTRKLSLKRVDGTPKGASVNFAPEQLKIIPKEQVAAFRMEAEYVEDGMEFVFDQEEFFKPRATASETKKIATVEEKIAAGFKPDTAWGLKLQTEVDEKIDALITSSMKKKFETVEARVETKVDTHVIPTYAAPLHGYASIKVGTKNGNN